MPEVVTSTLLTLAGLLALLAALAGTLIWIDGKPVGAIPSIRIRIVIGLVGACLIGTGVWLDYVRGGREAIPEKIVTRVERLEGIAATLQAASREATGEVGALQSQSIQLVKDVRLLALRTSMAASLSDDANCDNGHHGRQGGRMWIAAPGSVCEKTINSAWTIEIVVPLPTSGSALVSALAPLQIPVNLDPDARPGSNRLDELLAIVFPDEAPFDLVCKIRAASLQSAGLELRAAMTASRFRELTGNLFPSYTIQVGVPLSLFVAGNSKLTAQNWDTLCDKDATQGGFQSYLLDTSRKFSKRPGAREIRSSPDGGPSR